MTAEEIVGLYLGLLLVACLAGILVKLLKFPYTISLVLLGLIIALTRWGGRAEATVSKDMIFFLLLPPLLFQGSLHMDIDQLRRNMKPVGILAVFGVVVSTLIIGFLVSKLWGIPLLYGLLFGAIVSPTDPISVLAIFSKMGAPQRLRTIVEGESLFNDGTGVVVFSVILELIRHQGDFTALNAGLEFLRVSIGGLGIGFLCGYLAFLILKRIDDHLLEVAITVTLAYGVFFVAEHNEFSGVMAVVAAGLIIGNYGTIFSMSEKTRETVITFWGALDFMVNSLLFILIGLELRRIMLAGVSPLLIQLIIAIGTVLLARLVTVYGTAAICARIGRALPARWSLVLFWAGLRGSIPVALALGLPLGLQYRERLVLATFSVVFFSLVIQGLTMGPLIKWSKESEQP